MNNNVEIENTEADDNDEVKGLWNRLQRPVRSYLMHDQTFIDYVYDARATRPGEIQQQQQQRQWKKM